jgi:RNA polymerase sigma-70 factor, ECF subfamily
MEESDDVHLMGRVRSGDREAFAHLIDRYKDPMVSYLTRLTGDRDRAEDLAQETFIRLYRSSDRYVEQGRFTAYLYRIATNLLRTEERRRRRWRLLSLEFPLSGSGSNGHHPSPAAHRDMEQSELSRAIGKALAALPSRYRVPLVLREMEGLAYEEIARVTGWREGTVKSRINRGRRRLQETLAPWWNGGTA